MGSSLAKPAALNERSPSPKSDGQLGFPRGSPAQNTSAQYEFSAYMANKAGKWQPLRGYFDSLNLFGKIITLQSAFNLGFNPSDLAQKHYYWECPCGQTRLTSGMIKLPWRNERDGVERVDEFHVCDSHGGFLNWDVYIGPEQSAAQHDSIDSQYTRPTPWGGRVKSKRKPTPADIKAQKESDERQYQMHLKRQQEKEARKRSGDQKDASSSNESSPHKVHAA